MRWATSLRRRRVRQVGFSLAQSGFVSRLAGGLRSRLERRPRLWWAGGGLALVMVGGALSAAALGGGSAGAAQVHIIRAAPPQTLPDVARWDDWRGGTAYSIVLHGGASAIKAATALGTPFTFTTPDGGQLLGREVLFQLPDGSFVQQVSFNVGTTVGCLGGILGSGGSGGTPIVYNLQAHFDQYALVAYAHLSYAPEADKLAVAEVCRGVTGAAGETDLEMVAGCEAAANSCSNPVDSAGPTVTTYEGYVVTAEKNRTTGAWGQVYGLMSRALTAQYGAGDFASQMNAQVAKHGQITAITSVTVTPQISFDTAGQAYFTVTENVVVTGGDQAGTRQMTSYYLMESGTWVFWWSA
jgi:hypothetical protein